MGNPQDLSQIAASILLLLGEIRDGIQQQNALTAQRINAEQNQNAATDIDSLVDVVNSFATDVVRGEIPTRADIYRRAAMTKATFFRRVEKHQRLADALDQLDRLIDAGKRHQIDKK